MEKLIIIGSGAAGLTAAIYASRANMHPIVLDGKLPGGLLTQTSEVENFPGFPDGVNGYELMNQMRIQAEKFGAKLVSATVSSVELSDGGTQKITLDDGAVLEALSVIISTGATPRWLGVKGEQEFMNRGVSACATCDGPFYRNLPVVVAGGGDSAMEEALFLTHFASEVHVIHRRDSLRASKIMADRALANPKIIFHWNSTVDEIKGQNDVDAVVIKDVNTNAITEIPAKGFFAAIGHVPGTEAFKGQIELDDKECIILKNNTSCTNLKGVFAAGDCADSLYRQAITAAGMGARAAIDAVRYVESIS